jgi:hypothetical protein
MSSDQQLHWPVDQWRIRFRILYRTLNRYASIIVIALATITIICLSIFFIQKQDSENAIEKRLRIINQKLDEIRGNTSPDWPDSKTTSFDNISDGIYEIAQSLMLNMNPHEGSHWCLTIGRISAVLLVGMLAISVFNRIFKESLDLITVRWYANTGGDHIIICGLGRIGSIIAKQCLGQGRRVIVLERNPENENIRDIEFLGGVVFTENATDETILVRKSLENCRCVYVTTGDDTANIEITTDVLAIIQKQCHASFHCYIHMIDESTGSVLQQTFKDEKEWQRFTTFNYAAIATQRLIIDELATIAPKCPDETSLYIIIGNGSLCRTMIRQLAELSHFRNQRRARMLVLVPAPNHADAIDSVASFANQIQQAHGQLSPLMVRSFWKWIHYQPLSDAWNCRMLRPSAEYCVDELDAVEYVSNVMYAPLPLSWGHLSVLNEFSKIVRDRSVRPVVMVCHDIDEHNYSEGLRLYEALEKYHRDIANTIPIFIWMPRQQALANVLTTRKDGPKPFGQANLNMNISRLEKSIEDRLGRDVIMPAFFNLPTETASDRRAVANHWANHPAIFRHSDRMAAIQFLVKLACFGLELVDHTDQDEHHHGDALKSMSEFEFNSICEEMARIEHNRWMAERLLSGSRYGPEKLTYPPTRPTLIHWDKLPEIEKEKDRKQIKSIFQKLSQANYRVVFRGSNSSRH